jgi:hypothetical protein
MITTEEAQLLARTHDLVRFTLGMKAHEHDLTATALRSLAAERDALRARVAELEGALRDIVCGGYVSFTRAALGEKDNAKV